MSTQGDGRSAVEPAQLDESFVRHLDNLVAREQATQRLPTLTAGIVRDGALLWSAARGTTGLSGADSPTVDTQYRIGSISKTFVAVGVLRLRDEGALDLNDPIGRHLSELTELPVSIAQLLSHTSGLRAETPGPWWERTPGLDFGDLVASCLRPVDLLFRPGRRFHYSNPGYAVLGELLARKRGAPFPDAIAEELLEPLAMSRTALRPSPPHAGGLAVHPHADALLREPAHDARAMAPAGGLWSTLTDLSRWSQLLAGRRPELLRPETLREMQEPIAVADIPGEAWTTGYGLGLQCWNNNGVRQYGHSGSMPGFIAMLSVHAPTNDVLLALTNSTSGLRMAFCEQILAELAEEPTPVSAFAPASAVDPNVLELLGAWYWGPAEFRMSLASDGCLQLRGVPTGRHGSFRRQGDGSYIGEWGYFAGETLRARRRGDGSISCLDIASFIFTRTPYDTKADVPGGVDDAGWQPS